MVAATLPVLCSSISAESESWNLVLPELVKGLEAMLRVLARAVAPDSVHSDTGVLRVSSGGAETAHAVADASTGIIGLLEGMESDASKNRANVTATADSAAVTSSTAGESEGIIGSSQLSESEFPSLNSSGLGSLSSACARRVAVLLPLRLHVFALVLHLLLCLLLFHDACSNSWSDTVRVQGPTGRKRVLGGGSGPAEDLRLVSVEAGVNFRQAGGVRGQVAGFTSRWATRRRHQEGQGRCGHTFPPPGGS